jgi:hypothetical protein
MQGRHEFNRIAGGETTVCFAVYGDVSKYKNYVLKKIGVQL